MSVLRRAVLVVLPVVAAYVAVTPGAAAAATCGLSGSTVTVTVATGELVGIDRLATGEIRMTGSVCGAATVSNTDTIFIHGTGGTVQLGLTNPLGPGLTSESDGLSEIEITWNGTGTALEVYGSNGADDIRRSAGGGLHLNGDTDQDVTFTAQPSAVTVHGFSGDDTLDFARPAGSGATSWPLVLSGGGDNDVLRGDSGADVIVGNGGHDVITDGLGNDVTVNGGDGDDVFYAARAEQVNGAGGAVPDLGSSTTSVTPAIDRAVWAEVRVTVLHGTNLASVSLSLTHNGVSVPLASGRSGFGYIGTVFAPGGAAITTGGTTHTGRFAPPPSFEQLLMGDAADAVAADRRR
jgi:hypothetical protein